MSLLEKRKRKFDKDITWENHSSEEFSTSSSNSDQEWEVHSLLDKKTEGSQVFYLVKWKYWEGDPTWDKVEKLTNCAELLEEFERKFTQ